MQPFILAEDKKSGLQTPLLVDSPHSGRLYPPDFKYMCPLPMLRQTEDSYVDELIVGAVDAGASLITANYARSYIDLNRAENDIDPAVLAEPWPEPLEPSERTCQGLGLIRRLCKSSVPVYAAPLAVADVKNRITHFYRPYHAALQQATDDRLQKYGESYLLNVHSMPSQSQENRSSSRPDFVLGDRSGTSCDPSLTRRVRDLLHDQGYSVALNDPYKGVEIVRRYGQPTQGQHALQLEINRRLYMNERTLEKHDGFAVLRQNLTQFFSSLVAELVCETPDRLAAE